MIKHIHHETGDIKTSMSLLQVLLAGATHRSMARQAENILAKMQDANFTVGDIDFANDWKLITLFIGGNDLCRVCEDWVRACDVIVRFFAHLRWLIIHLERCKLE